MIKLIIQNKIGTATIKCSVCSEKFPDLFLWHQILVLALDILGFVEKVLPLFLNSLGWRQLEGVFFFFFFSAFLGLMGLML
jgi:hypothetical protein